MNLFKYLRTFFRPSLFEPREVAFLNTYALRDCFEKIPQLKKYKRHHLHVPVISIFPTEQKISRVLLRNKNAKEEKSFTMFLYVS